MTVIADAPTYPHGYVVGRYLTAVADTAADSDRLMDFTPAKGRVIFTPERGHRTTEGPVPTFVVQRPVECPLDDQGYLTSPGGGRGVGLIVGVYLVRFEVQGAQVPGPSRIEVREDHTEATPLDLILAMPEVVPPGSVVVVDETTAQRAEAAAARAEAIVTDIESEVRAVVLASPELKGKSGADGVSIVDVTAVDGVATVTLSDGTTRLIDLPPGEAGHTPVLSWEGARLLVDGVPGPDLRGPAGPAPSVSWAGDRLTVGGQTGPSLTGPQSTVPGPAPSIKIGTVTSGGTASATITGTSPDLTLGLVLPKGDPGTKGDPGAPGVVSSASSYVIVGPGRPDQPSTTAGAIPSPDTTPVGARYESVDEAGVGARTWRKVAGNKWIVADGDTGVRDLTALVDPKSRVWSENATTGRFFLRRVGAQVQVIFADMRYQAAGTTDYLINFPAGFRPPAFANGLLMAGDAAGILRALVFPNNGAVRVTGPAPAHPLINGMLFYYTAEPWPTAPLPGTPA